MTGESIAVTIEKALGSCHLDLSLLRGQAYDGASNMAGKYRGCAAIIQNKHPRALYSHCCSRELNIAMVSSCSLVIVQNLFSVMNKVYKFFDNHPKCQYALNECSSMKVKSLCKTRWLQSIDAFHVFMDMFDSIVQCFDSITNDQSGWSRDALVDAIALSKCLLDFEFIIALHVVERYMSYTESLTRALQARALHIVQAVQHIGVLKQVLTDARSEVEQQFNCLFLNASKCASKHGILVSAPRRCARQTARENHPGSPEEYYIITDL